MPHASLVRLSAAAAVAAVLGCSAVSSVDYVECTESAECRAAFGLGHTCGAAGLCEAVAAFERCEAVYPQDLFKAPEKYRDVVLIGSLFDHTPETGDGKLVKATSLAIAEANETGLADGRLFGVVHCGYQEDTDLDELSSEEAAVESAKYLVDTLGAAAIVGPGTSGLAEAVYRELADPRHAERTLVISPSATSPSLTDIDVDEPGLFWRTAPPDTLIGKVLAEYMNDESVTAAAVLYEGGAYGKGLFLELKGHFEAEFGGEIDAYEYTDPKQIPAILNQLVQSYEPDPSFGVVFIASEVAQVTAFLNGAAAAEPTKQLLTGSKVFLGDAARNEDVLEQTPSAADIYPHIRGVFPGVPSGTVYDLFLTTYAAEWSEQATDASYSAHTYDATWLAIYGAAWSYFQHEGRITGPFMAEGLQRVSAGAPININSTSWNSVKKAFKEGVGVNVRGASGELDYDPETEETSAPVERWVIVEDGGKWSFQTVKQ